MTLFVSTEEVRAIVAKELGRRNYKLKGTVSEEYQTGTYGDGAELTGLSFELEDPNEKH